MAACGAKVLMLRCVEYARRYRIPIHVRSSFSNRDGTWVTDTMPPGVELASTEGEAMEQAIISGVAQDRGEAKITVVGVPDKVGEAARIFRAIADAAINIDMIVQNVSAAATGRTDISFTLPRDDGHAGMAALRAMQDEVGLRAAAVRRPDRQGLASSARACARTRASARRFFGALAEAGINIEMISTSEIRISVVVDQNDVEMAVGAVHAAFELGDGEEHAVVYGGTGR